MKLFSHLFACVTGALAFGLLVWVIFTGLTETLMAVSMTTMVVGIIESVMIRAYQASVLAQRSAMQAPFARLHHWRPDLVDGVIFLCDIMILRTMMSHPTPDADTKGSIIAFCVVMGLIMILAAVQIRYFRTAVLLGQVEMAREIAKLRGGVPLSPLEMEKLEKTVAELRCSGRI